MDKHISRRQAVKAGIACALAAIGGAVAGSRNIVEAATPPPVYEIVWGNDLTFDGETYYLNVNFQHRNEKQFACNPNACLVIPKAQLDYFHWKGWCWSLPGRPKKWQLR